MRTAIPADSPRIGRVRALGCIAVIAVASLQISAARASPSCARELGTTESTLIKAALRLRSIAQTAVSEECTAYRQQIATVGRVREVFARCLSGPHRESDLQQLDQFIGNANDRVAAACGN
jgi:hypothetical protein